jgi:DNA topoisomerase VI subunit B
MSKLYNSSTGEFIREQSEQEEQVYNALQKWAERLNKWEFNKQWIRNKKQKLKTFSPNAFSLVIIENCNKLLNQQITPEEAMSLLHTVEGRTEIRLCLEAGF